jgi:hypothetical protein
MTHDRRPKGRERLACDVPARGWQAALVCALAACAAGCDVVTGAAQRAGVVPTFEAHCAKALPPTRVEVAALPADHDTDFTRSYAELTRMGVEAEANERVIGLTRARIGHAATITVVGIEEPGTRRVCVRPEIRVELSLTPMTVFVGREFRDDACRRSAIIEHELKHVAVYRETLEAMAGEARDEIARAYGNTVMLFASRDEAQREIEAALTGYLGPLLEHSTREARRRQADVDTPDEYARVAGACGGIELKE